MCDGEILREPIPVEFFPSAHRRQLGTDFEIAHSFITVPARTPGASDPLGRPLKAAVGRNVFPCYRSMNEPLLVEDSS